MGNNYYLSLIPKQPSVGNDCFFLLLNETTNDCPSFYLKETAVGKVVLTTFVALYEAASSSQ